MSQLLAFWTKHQKKVYAVLGALAVIVVLVVAVYLWRKTHEKKGEEDDGGDT